MGEIPLRQWLSNLTKWRGTGSIDPEKVKVVAVVGVGAKGEITPEISVSPRVRATVQGSTASLAQHPFTVPVGKYWVLKTAIHSNDNRNTFFIVVAPNGLTISASVIGVATQEAELNLPNLRYSAGDVITIGDAEFVAADAVVSNLVYEEYDA